MAIEVLKLGDNNWEDMSYVTLCYSCKSVLEFTQNDARICNDSDGDYLVVTCPTCNGSVCVDV